LDKNKDFSLVDSELFEDVSDNNFLELIQEVNNLGANIYKVKEKKDNKKIAVFYNDDKDTPVYYANRFLAQDSIAAKYNRYAYQMRISNNTPESTKAVNNVYDFFETEVNVVNTTQMIKDILSLVQDHRGRYVNHFNSSLDLADIVEARSSSDIKDAIKFFKNELDSSSQKDKKIIYAVLNVLKVNASKR
jgi:hypothetical protein